MADVRDLARFNNQMSFERVRGARSGNAGAYLDGGELKTGFDYYIRGSAAPHLSATSDAVMRLQGTWTNDPKKQYFVTITDTDGHPNLDVRAEKGTDGEAQLRIINAEPGGVAEVLLPLGSASHLDESYYAPDRFKSCGPIEKLEVTRKDDVFGFRINERYLFAIQPEDGRFIQLEDT